VVILAWVSMTIAQISLQPGGLPPAIATASIVTPLVGVVLGVTLFQETLHDTTLGVALSILALAVVFVGIVVLAMGEGPARARSPGSPVTAEAD
jgi:hypothetical protein